MSTQNRFDMNDISYTFFFEKNRLINRTKDIHLTQIINVDISKTPEFSINHSFKKDSKEIKDYLESKGIRYF